MRLDTSRFLSDRLIFDDQVECKFRIANSFWDWIQRIISWVSSPESYSEENRRTVESFQRYLVDTLGGDRLQKISNRYQLDWEEMKKNPLLSRDVSKILIGSHCVSVEEVNARVGNFLNVDSNQLSQTIRELSSPFDQMWEVAEITSRIMGRPSQWLSRFFYDPLLADRELLQLVKSHPQNTFDNFMNNMLARVIKREPSVGALIPAPNHPEGRPQFYYISAKLVTGKGMVSYILHPAGNDTNLEPIRLFRGTSARNSEIDALSTIITDLEKDLGMKAYRSGIVFEPIIQERLGTPAIEGGHSMGATLVQHRLVDMDHIRRAYLYSGPGITEEEVLRFNRKNPNVHLVIRVAENDSIRRVGEAHLGYNAPPNVEVDYVQYRPTSNHDHDPHVSVWGNEPEYFEEGVVNDVNSELYHRDGLREYFRSLMGPITAVFLECMRDFIRFFFSSRINDENGLYIMNRERWQVDHFRAV